MPAPTAPVAPVQPEPATAPDAAQQAEATSFEAWKRDFARKALDAGISEKTVRSALEPARLQRRAVQLDRSQPEFTRTRSEEHTSELQSQSNLVCRLLLEKKKRKRPESYFDH